MGIFSVPTPKNEPIYGYAPESPERAKLEAAIKQLKNEKRDIPMYIGSREVKTKDSIEITAPGWSSRMRP